MTATIQIGFSQRIRLEWLERTAELVLAGHTRDEIQATLLDLLREQLSVGGNAKRGNREKAISILLSIWVTVPKTLEPFRDDGLKLLRRLPAQDHLAVHWGMTMAAYPFFAVVAEVVGRLLRLQGSVGAAQVQRRIREQLGERETVARAARRTLRGLIDWNVLQETERKGVYQAPPVHPVEDPRVSAWLVEAALIAGGSDSGVLRAIIQSPAFFPFAIASFNGNSLRDTDRLEFFRQGLDEDVVMLRSTRSSTEASTVGTGLAD